MALTYIQLQKELLKSNDFSYLSKIVDEYIEQNDPEFLNVMAKDPHLKYHHIFNQDTMEIILSMAHKKNPDGVNKYENMLSYIGISIIHMLKAMVVEFGQKEDYVIGNLGFKIILVSHRYRSLELKKYIASLLLNKIFIINKPLFATRIRKRFRDYKSLEKLGINKYLLSYIYGEDEDLYEFCLAHKDLIDNLKEKIELKEILDENLDVVSEKANRIYETLKPICLEQADLAKKMMELLSPTFKEVYKNEIEFLEQNNMPFTLDEMLYHYWLSLVLVPSHENFKDSEELLLEMFFDTPPINELYGKRVTIDLTDFNQKKCYNEVLNRIKFLPEFFTPNGGKIISFQNKKV